MKLRVSEANMITSSKQGWIKAPWASIGILFACLCFAFKSTVSLKCYQCENEQSNYLCMSDFNLVDCEADMDTCQTMVTYSDKSEKLSIIKMCTQNRSCELQINATRDTMPCDKSRSSWVCTNCCYENGCNKDGATSVTHSLSILGILLLITFVHNSLQWR